MAIKIPVSASIDPGKINEEINKLGQSIAKANKVKYEPVSGASVKNLDEIEKKFRNLLQISGEMRRRLNVSGQGDKGFFDVDWSKAYENNATRAKKMAQSFSYVTGGNFSQGAGGRQGGHGAISNAVAGAAQAGLRASNGATAGVGGVVANSLGSGMSAGIGAGLAGLLGGILALGVGKIVSAATEKMGEAENNAWANDQLKRAMGDTQVSFKALQASVNAASDNIHVTYSEGGKLAAQFAKLGNLTAAQYKSIGGEIETGGGLGKAFGLDPSAGVGFLGQMRGMRLTQDESGSRKMALIIGETIAKSGAFAKADEVMEAISGYATSQARSSLSANTTDYAAALAGLTSSGMVGLDVGGSAGILNRANSALMGGGAKGEASQFFSAMVGAKQGLDPYQLQVWREGGAFSTLDDVQKFGMGGPGGSKTFMEASMAELQSKYGHNRGQLLNATGNHLGMSMRQASALIDYKPADIGEMQRRLGSDFDLSSLNASAIGTMGRLVTGDSSVRSSVAEDLLGRKDLTDDERNSIRSTMATGTADEQKNILMRLVASREQEMTDGKNIHDSKVALDNIKTSIANQLIPLTQSIRDGIMYMAGGGEKSQYEINQKILQLESSDKQNRINRMAEADLQAINDDVDRQKWDILLDPNNNGGIQSLPGWDKVQDGTATADEMEDFKDQAKRALSKHGTRYFSDDTADRLAAVKADKESRVEALEETRRRESDAEQKRLEAQQAELDRVDRETGIAPVSAKSVEDFKDPDEKKNVAAFLDMLGKSEGAGYNTLVGDRPGKDSITDLSKHPNKVGLVTGDGPSTAAGKYQFIGSTYNRIAKRIGLKDFSPESQDKAAIELLREKGVLDEVMAGDFHGAAKRLGGTWQSLYTGTSKHQGKRSKEYFDRAMNDGLRRHESGTPMPADAPPMHDGRGEQRITFDDINIIHRNERGEPTGQYQKLTGRFSSPRAFGTEAMA